MATDGVKIIDGDLAHDTYWGIMDLYDSNTDIDTIKKEFPFIRPDYYDDFEYEIFVTSYALAFWEIGLMTNEILQEVQKVIEKGACVRDWAEECGEKEGKARQKELNKLWKKISQTNLKIRPRKKYRKITNLYFQPDDLLAFKLKDNNYRAVICAQIDQYRGQCNYIFVPTTYNSSEKPTIEGLRNKEILGRKIGSGYDQERTKQHQPDIERIWKLYGDESNFFFGIVKLAVDHKDLIHFKDRFEKVGSLKIAESLKQTGQFGYEDNFDRFEHIFSDIDNHIKIFQQGKFPVTALCDL